LPYVIEPSVGVDRLFLALLFEFYDEDVVDQEERRLFRFPSFLSPIEVAVFPLLGNRENLVNKAKEVYKLVKENFVSFYDESGSIGRRYRRQDEIGTPFCLTIDFQTLEDNTLTIRDRDTTKQERIKIEEVKDYLKEKLNF
jgi:glycyl-tRNA synthetase